MNDFYKYPPSMAKKNHGFHGYWKITENSEKNAKMGIE
jgi:hypothetical protein